MIEHSPEGLILTISERETRLWSKAALLDVAERLIIILLFAHFAYINISVFEQIFDIKALLLLISECLPVFLVLVRKASGDVSVRPLDWAFGLAGTAFPLLVTPTMVDSPLVPAPIFYVVIVLGQCVQIYAKVSLGTSFGIVAANRGVKQLGPYRFVRHPMYAGYVLTQIGLLLALPSLRNAAFYFLALMCQVVRIECEERVLRRDATYRSFAERVRYRMVPGIF
jgi:protein-S-isoprenylcysteine O-methyltransferase Ste14